MKSEHNNKVFIATSLDGYIADKDGGIEWLDTFPEINTIDSGYESFTANIDALLMGRSTFEKVLSFDIPWPYTKPVFVASNSLTSLPKDLSEKVWIVNGPLNSMLKEIHNKGYNKLYIDGGRLIQNMLQEDLIDEMVITVIPILLGGGIPLFGELKNRLVFECKETNLYIDKIVQNLYIRRRNTSSKL